MNLKKFLIIFLSRTSYNFDGIIKLEDFDIDDILIDEKSSKNILICNIFHKTLIEAELLPIRFDRIDGFIRIYDGNRYLTLFGSEKYDVIYNRFRCLLSNWHHIFFSHYYAKIKVDFYDSLTI